MTDGSSLAKVRSALFGVFVPVMFVPTIALISFGLTFDAEGLLGNVAPGLALLGAGVLLLLVFTTLALMVLDRNRDHPLFGNTALERAYNWLHIRAWLGCSCSVDAVLGVVFILSAYFLHQGSFLGPLIGVAIAIPVVFLISITIRMLFASYLGVTRVGLKPDLHLHASSLAALSSVLLSSGEVSGTHRLEESVRVCNQFLHNEMAPSASVDRTIAVLSFLARHRGADPHIEAQRKLATELSDTTSLLFIRVPGYCAEFNANFGWLEHLERPKIAVPGKGLRGVVSRIPVQGLALIGPALAFILALFPGLPTQLLSTRVVYTLIVLAIFSGIPTLLAADSMISILGPLVPPWQLSELREAALKTEQ